MIFHYGTVQEVTFVWLGEFANMRKATIRFVMSVLPSVCLSVRMGNLGYQWTDFHVILYLSIF